MRGSPDLTGMNTCVQQTVHIYLKHFTKLFKQNKYVCSL